MSTSITPAQIRENNRQLIYQLIYNRRRLSLQDIAYELRLSRPTVTGKLNELEQEGLIRKDGSFTSEQAGRKAAAFTVVSDYRVAVGVDLGSRNFSVVILDLYGTVLDRTTVFLEYADNDAYYKRAASEIETFLTAADIRPEQVLGIGFSVPALVSPDGQSVVYGELLHNTGMTADRFAAFLSYPCTLFHDANSAAAAALWKNPELDNALYLNLSYHLSSAFIADRSVMTGRHGQGSTLEHLKIRKFPDAAPCYCGKTGCLETVCSVSALLQKDETLASFFHQVRTSHPEETSRFDVYLQNLAEAVSMARAFFDCTVILGGDLAEYLTKADVERLYAILRETDAFSKAEDYLLLGDSQRTAFAVGAALPFVWRFLGQSGSI